MFRQLLICAVLGSLVSATPAKTTSPTTSSIPMQMPTPTACPVHSAKVDIVGFPTSIGAVSLPISKIFASSTNLYTGPPWGTTVEKYVQPTACAEDGETVSFLFTWQWGPVTRGTTLYPASWSAHSEAEGRTWDYTCSQSGGPFSCEETSTSGSFTTSTSFLGRGSRTTVQVMLLGDKMPAPTPTSSSKNGANETGSKPTNTPGAGAVQTVDVRLAGAAIGAAVVLIGAMGL